jgi:hypothetical protein
LWIAPCGDSPSDEVPDRRSVLNREKGAESAPKHAKVAFLCPFGHSVLELPAGAIAATSTEPGHELEFSEA